MLTDSKFLKKRIAKPNYKRRRIFHENLVGVDLEKTKIVLFRPMQVGFAVLEISKVLMYQFHYHKWLPKFPEAKLLFTDTDSLCYSVNQNPYEMMASFPDEFDFSEYAKDHQLYDSRNMKVLGKMKDECHGLPLQSFRGLRPKLYCMEKLTTFNGTEVEIKGKGLTKTVREKQLTVENFETCLQQHSKQTVTQYTIRSDHHNLYSYKMEKIGLSAADDKRWIQDDGISTYAHGHFRTRNLSENKQ